MTRRSFLKLSVVTASVCLAPGIIAEQTKQPLGGPSYSEGCTNNRYFIVSTPSFQPNFTYEKLKHNSLYGAFQKHRLNEMEEHLHSWLAYADNF